MRNSTVARPGLLQAAIALVVSAATVAAQETSPDGPRVALTPRVVPAHASMPGSAMRVDVRMVLIPVTVTDSYGATLAGLPAKSFHLFEDGVEQQITSFSSEPAPTSLGIVFDSSRSMEDKMDQSRAAVSAFLRTAMTGDEYFVVGFSDKPRLLCPFTTDLQRLEQTLVNLKSENWTALLDAVYLSIRQTPRGKNSRKSLLILSDGADNYSRYTESEMKAAVREADVSIYSIALVGRGLMNRHVRLLRQLSDETGGLLCQVSKLSELPDAVEKISNAIRQQYLLGYVSSKPGGNGLYRKIQVKMDQPPDAPRRLHAAWRSGYYAPGEP